jgi:hypothetical protein
MNEPKPAANPAPKDDAKAGTPVAAAGAPEQAPPPVALTPEQQMEAFERELKETDWGHQPC